MPNNEYVLRSDALKAVCENCSMHGSDGEPCSSRCEDYALVQKIPAADVEPVKHGYWVYKMRERNKCEFVSGFDHLGDWHTITVITHVKGPVPYCGLCGALAAESFLDHCPRCGAKMDTEPPKEEDNAD
ncbi:MAG: hypothetical protein E7576_08030 [Ruminococcaceae bacterium]|nr:hypothetical protein [Oscillospiraceae bacterium]